MPERGTIERAREDAREGKSASTQAGEFVREEIHHIREGKHGAASPQQAIAIGLSKARRAGVKLAAPGKGKTSAKVREQALRDNRKGQSGSANQGLRPQVPRNPGRVEERNFQRGIAQIAFAPSQRECK
jgi:hypothetical protein